MVNRGLRIVVNEALKPRFHGFSGFLRGRGRCRHWIFGALLDRRLAAMIRSGSPLTMAIDAPIQCEIEP
jgi:hypothetical protein